MFCTDFLQLFYLYFELHIAPWDVLGLKEMFIMLWQKITHTFCVLKFFFFYYLTLTGTFTCYSTLVTSSWGIPSLRRPFSNTRPVIKNTLFLCSLHVFSVCFCLKYTDTNMFPCTHQLQIKETYLHRNKKPLILWNHMLIKRTVLFSAICSPKPHADTD